MHKNTDLTTIADSSRPNAGRIYDYLLGGTHNFEIDRQATTQIVRVAPFLPQVLKLIRWFLGEATRRLAAEGHTRFLDFASGLPTLDHIHEVTPAGTRVLYSDIDPVTVETARAILSGNPNARYVQCDAATPEVLLRSEVVGELFGRERRVAVGLNGIVYFLTDEQVAHALHVLYDWVAPGSVLFLSDADAATPNENLKALFAIYEKIGQPITIRASESLLRLAAPWKAIAPGVLPLETWLGMDPRVQALQTREWGGRGFYGVILQK